MSMMSKYQYKMEIAFPAIACIITYIVLSYYIRKRRLEEQKQKEKEKEGLYIRIPISPRPSAPPADEDPDY